MIEIVYEFVAKEKARAQFELAYGPGGAWSKLFAQAPGFRGTTLLRDTRDPRRYLAIDLWDTEAERVQVLAECEAEYAELQAAFGEWTESRAELGIFQVRAEATVYPRGRVRRSGGRPTRRRSGPTAR
jgi:heme-degrading monooxygenase HmoA